MRKRNEIGCEQLDNDVELQAKFREWAPAWAFLGAVFILVLIIGIALIPVFVAVSRMK